MTTQQRTTNTNHPGYARLLPQPLTHHFQTARSDPNATSLADEIALLRTFLAHYLATFQDNQPITADDLERVARHVERISRLVARQARILVQDPERVIREERVAWTKQVHDQVQQVLIEFLPSAKDFRLAEKRLAERLLQHGLLDEEPPTDRSPQDGSPSLARNEPISDDGDVGAPLAAPGSGPAPARPGGGQEPDRSHQMGSPSLARNEQIGRGPGGRPNEPIEQEPDDKPILLAEYDARLRAMGLDPHRYPRPRTRCCAHDYNIMRRCENPPVPGSYNCERHQSVPPVEAYTLTP
jgi:hypothetical protein